MKLIIDKIVRKLICLLGAHEEEIVEDKFYERTYWQCIYCNKKREF